MKKLIFFLLTLPVLNFAQSFIQQKSDEFSEIYPVEKVYIHTNSSLYQPGETIFFKAYVTDGEQQISSQSSLLYVDVINPAGSVVKKLTYWINSGRVSGSYDIDFNSNGGLYKLKAYTWWQKNSDSDIFEKEITVQRFIAPRLLMKLEVEKEAYGEGDEVSSKVSVRNLQDIPIKNLEFEYEAEIDGQTIVRQTAVTDEEGNFQIRFNLPKKLSGNDGSLNVKFEYESNVESISRTIPILLQSIDLQFLPEGGYSISDFPHRFAFKALNKYGNPADVQGTIVDGAGNKIADFESFHQGLGSVELTQETGKKYFAKITAPFVSESLIELPSPKNRPASLELNRINDEEVKAVIYSAGSKNLKLVAKTVSKIYFEEMIQLNPGKNELNVSTGDFPVGILQFTLFDDNQPIAERLIFNGQDLGLKIEIETDKEIYNTREKVNAKIQTKLADGKPVSANLSVSVLNDKLISFLDDRQHNINSWLLAGSELSGEIYEPEFYFDPKEEKRNHALDLLLMTQGWRFYNWEKIFSEDTVKIKYAAENYQKIEGVVSKVKRNGKRIPLQTNLYLIDDARIYLTKSDKDGRFDIQIPFRVSFSSILVETKPGEEISVQFDKLKKDKPIEIVRKPNSVYDNSEAILKESDEKPEETKIEPSGNKDKSVNYDGMDDSEVWWEINGDNIELEVVSVSSSVYESLSAGISVTISRLPGLSPASSVGEALSGKVVGLSTVGTPGVSNPVVIRGAAGLSTDNPLIVIDGIPISAAGWESLPISQINSITVLKGNDATSIYGSRALNGAIIITTVGNISEPANLNINVGKKMDLKEIYYSDPYINHYGEVREFYMPKYESLKTSDKNDFRQCIYWNYDLTTDKEGKAEFYFYNSDESTVFRIIAEGFDGNGSIGRSEKTFSTRDEIEIETKFPLYATEGDEIQMPVWVKNNSAEILDANMSFDLPGPLTLKNHKYDLQLKPNEIQTFNSPIRVENGSEGDYKFRVNLLTNDFRQSVIRDLKLFGRGFPKSIEQSSIEKAEINFNSLNIIPGSESAIFAIYLNPLEPILSGVEKIISQPHGCFEQLTSSVYPNIYALKLLESYPSGENQKLEKKARRYMNSGYRKMTAYEVKGGGFEWFGHQPASVYLTAFGLIQYTEMKDYLNVDQKMLNRTLDWLISRKDSVGGYNQERKYQKITNQRYLITNAYTNYALSFAGVKDIEFQYKTALEEVKLSRDLYRMVLTALTAHQLGKVEDFNLLMEMLKNGISGKGIENITAQGSITYSGKKSLRTEILAFYAQALMKSGFVSAELNQVMKEIILSGSKGYFGSTQATGLALKAIYEYNRLYNQTPANDGDRVFLEINGQTVIDKPMTEFLELGEKEKKNLFEFNVLKYLKPGSSTVKMELESEKLSFIDFSYLFRSTLPDNSSEAKVKLESSLSKTKLKIGDTGRMKIQVENLTSEELPMTIAKIGIPGGLTVEPKLLKEMIENEKVSYYELEDNFLVLYWRYLDPKETKTVELVFKAEVPGLYTGVASSAYLYYTEEFKNWNEGLKIEIEP
ncbi:MAG: TonB-dependent receptor plug domain-containing protein [Moheibacter sp.]